MLFHKEQLYYKKGIELSQKLLILSTPASFDLLSLKTQGSKQTTPFLMLYISYKGGGSSIGKFVLIN